MNLTLKLSFALLSIPPILELFLRFDSVHDGLMLSTIRLTRESIMHGGEWPFNQYGQFWVFPYTFLTIWVPANFLLLSLRIIALGCYLLTARLIWKLINPVTNRSTVIFSLLLLLASQPFYTAWGLIPWPSAISMPLVMGVMVILAKPLSSISYNLKKESYSYFFAGVLVTMIASTRIQIGLLALIASTYFIFLSRGIRQVLNFLIGVISSTGALCLLLAQLGWLHQALFDQFVFGSQYVKSNAIEGYSSTPVFTLLGSFAVILTYKFGRKALTKLKARFSTRFVLINLAALGLISYLIFTYVLYRRQPSILFSLTIISGRFWVSLLLGSIIFSLMEQVFRSIHAIKNNEFSDTRLQQRNLLLGFSIVAQAQSWPLFDASHTWWGSAPGVLLVAVLITERFGLPLHSIKVVHHLKVSFLTLLLILTLGLDLLYFAHSDQRFFKNINFITLRADSKTVANVESLQDFFTKHLKKGSKVLNLCSTPDVFLRDDFVAPASRIFFYWPSFQELPSYMNSISISKPDSILYCATSESGEISGDILKILNNVAPKRKLIADWISPSAQNWKIWESNLEGS